MNSDDTQYHTDTVNEPLASCSRCFTVMPISMFNRWNDETTAIEQRHCDACAALTHCGVCGVEGHASNFEPILLGDEFVMDVCAACDSKTVAVPLN